MKSQVIKDHKSNYPKPIEFESKEKIEIGFEDLEYPGWIRVKTQDGNEGWAPIEYIEIVNDTNQGIAKFSYNARELDVGVGEILQIKDTLCGWYYATNSSGDSGWVPAECVYFT